MTTKHTPGPWFSDAEGRIWRRDPRRLYQNGGEVAGDKPLAFVNAGWSGEGVTGYPVEHNARLIAAAPDLLEALQALVNQSLQRGVPTDPGHPDRIALALAESAISKATGEQP